MRYPADADKLERLLRRRQVQLHELESTVNTILTDVRKKGDKAVARYSKKFDGVLLTPEKLKVTAREVKDAVSRTDKKLVDVLKKSAANIRKFHEKQKMKEFEFSAGQGAKLGMRYVPVRRAGVYVPGGQAAYPSTVLMNVIPAQVAGVDEIYVVTPPGRDGTVPDALLAAVSLLEVSAVFKVGGIQAVAALVHGTGTIPPVDVIVGPGNKYVTAAKKTVMGQVGIDSIAGPSEVVILADDTARPDFIAADMLAQAEHDADAMSCLVTSSEKLAAKVDETLESFMKQASRKAVIRKSLRAYGTIIITENMKAAETVVDTIAPEHLEIVTRNPRKNLAGIRNAGAVFLGNYSPVAAGDYFAGPNHVLPTAGSARFSSPLGVYNFMKGSSIIEYTEQKMRAAADSVALFAEAEGLFAHAMSAAIRKDGGKKQPGVPGRRR